MNTIFTISQRTRIVRFSLLTIGLMVIMGVPTVDAQQDVGEETTAKSLPPGIKISGERDPLMDIEDPLISQDEINGFRRKQTSYVQALRAGELTPSARELVAEGIRIRLYELTLPDRAANLNSIKRTFMRDLQNHAGAQQINPRLRRKFREMVLDETLVVLRELLSNHLQVRVKAAIIAGQLNIEEEDRRAQTPPEPYEPALDFLNEILNDRAQADVVKIAAVTGLIRLLESEEISLSRNDRLQTAERMNEELKNAGTFYWYQVKLIHGLQASQMDVDRSGSPFIVEGLAQVMSDSSRDPRVRSDAAFALPRVPMPPNVNLSVLAWQVAKVIRELTEQYNRQPEQIFWTSCFLKLYGAFQPLKQGMEEGLLFITKQPAYAAHAAAVTQAYTQVVPVIKAIWDNQGGVQVPANTIVPLTDWLETNDPGESSLYPGGPSAATLSQTDTTSTAGP